MRADAIAVHRPCRGIPDPITAEAACDAHLVYRAASTNDLPNASPERAAAGTQLRRREVT